MTAMATEDRYSILFEPVQIGPVTARNRFYQVPHCCGFGHLRPRAHAAMRAVKAEGGWAVVSTEETEIHPSSDLSPYAEQRIWDERDASALGLMVDAVHAHGALAAIELTHCGSHVPNLSSRIPPFAPSHAALDVVHPGQARAMAGKDIRALRRWHRRAVRLARKIGFDIVYVYAGHHMSLAHTFMSPRSNQRRDEYGGSLENRVRLARELLEDAQEEAAGECAIAFRFAVDDLLGEGGMQAHEEGRAVVEILSDLPDLWDVNVAGWENDSQTSRFAPNEGYQEEYTAFVKRLTAKPVVGVGRYTSPDKMVSLVRAGVLDFIGAARPSIADPYLPNKIRDGQIEEICECIGCNICVASDNLCVPIRCTQNPTVGEEWRRGWHPQRTVEKASDDAVLVVGAGPAGLECARQLGERGYSVSLAEAGRELGGRVLMESSLKGLGIWLRVRDFREQVLARRDNVTIYRESRLSAEDICELEFPHVLVATGSRWRWDGVGRSSRSPIAGLDSARVMTPEEIASNETMLPGPIVVFDDDQAYLGSVVADHLSERCEDVTLVTPGGVVSAWTVNTLEQERIQTALIRQGVKILVSRTVVSAGGDHVETACIFTGRTTPIPCATLVLVTERWPDTTLADALQERLADGPAGRVKSVQVIGDALAPGLIADAVYSGHLAARDFQRDPRLIGEDLYRREMPSLSDGAPTLACAEEAGSRR